MTQYQSNNERRGIWDFLTEKELPYSLETKQFAFLIAKKGESFLKQKTEFYCKLGVKKECSLPQLKYLGRLIETFALKLSECLMTFLTIPERERRRLEDVLEHAQDIALRIWKDLRRIEYEDCEKVGLDDLSIIA